MLAVALQGPVMADLEVLAVLPGKGVSGRVKRGLWAWGYRDLESFYLSCSALSDFAVLQPFSFH